MGDNKILVLGVGNVYRNDDGIGPKIIQRLQKKIKKQEVVLVDGGVDGLALLDIIQKYSKAILIDAVQMNEKPGTIKQFSPQEARIKIKSDALSTHGIGLAEVIGLVEKLGFKTDLTIIGIQPKDISFGENLTEEIAAIMDKVAGVILKLLVEGKRIVE